MARILLTELLMRKPKPRGFTLIELMFVVTLVITIILIAVPSFRTFTARDQDASVATFVTHEFNRVKGQAQRRSRAYLVSFLRMNRTAPAGRIEIREGAGSSCTELAANVNARSRVIANYSMGNDEVVTEQIPGMKTTFVGLAGWVPPGGNLGNPLVTDLVFCARVDGSLMRIEGNAVTPVSGQTQLLVQRYETAEGPANGPPRRLRFDFAQPARLVLEAL